MATSEDNKLAVDTGELRAVADVLGHSPDMLMKTYAHALTRTTRFNPRRRRPNRQPRDGNNRMT